MSDFNCGQIIGVRRVGASISKTVAFVGCSCTTVSTVYQEWNYREQTSNTRDTIGQPHVVSPQGEYLVASLVAQSQHTTDAQLTHQYNISAIRHISCALLYLGFHSWQLTWLPILTTRHRQQCLIWAKEHQWWTLKRQQKWWLGNYR